MVRNGAAPARGRCGSPLAVDSAALARLIDSGTLDIEAEDENGRTPIERAWHSLDRKLGRRSMELTATEVMPRVNAAIKR